MKFKVEDFKFNEEGQMMAKYDEERGKYVLPIEALNYMSEEDRYYIERYSKFRNSDSFKLLEALEMIKKEFEMTDPVLDTYINTISDLFKARTDPTQQEEYYYMMLANAGYDYEEATEILDEYYKDKCPFGIKNEIKQQIEKPDHRPWPMLEDITWDNMMYKNEKQRNSLQSIIDILTSEALYELGINYKGDDDDE